MLWNWRRPVIHALVWLRKRDVIEQLRLVRALQWKSPEEIRDFQERRLEGVLRFAWRETAYYREVLGDCRVVVDGEVHLENFENLPFLTKDVIREQGARLRARVLPPGRRAFLNRTGGSTGEPCEYWQDTFYDAANIADKIYHFESFGKLPGEREMKVWGSTRDLLRDTSGLQARLKNFLYNRRVENCSRLSEERILAIVEHVNRFRPRAIWGYIDGMYTLADYLVRRGVVIHSPAAVFCGGGTFYPHMAQAIETAFRCPAVNYYGSREMGAVACQCEERDGLHVTSHSHVVEVVGEDGLPNLALPFIRYRIGDRGRMTGKQCRCGRGFPTLESVAGRTMESFLRRNGEIVSPIYLITMIGTSLRSGQIRRFQLVQEDFSRLRLRVVPGAVPPGDLRACLEPVCARIRELMGDECDVSVETADELPPTASGKYLYTVCKIDPSQQARAARGLTSYGNRR